LTQEVQASRPTVSPAFVLEDSDLAELDNTRTKLGNGDAEQQLVTIAGHYG
jgi:hypothetical protein